MSTFVSIGNATQNFSRFFSIIDSVSDKLPKPIVVQSGYTEYENRDFEVIPFLEMSKFIRYIRESDLIILHAGAGSLIHTVLAGKKPIVIPRLSKYGEHVDDHQLEFSKQLDSVGKAYVVLDEKQMEMIIDEALEYACSDVNSVIKPMAFGILEESLDMIASSIEKQPKPK